MHEMKRTMKRELTPQEDAELLTFMQANPTMNVGKIAQMFEEKFATPITGTHLAKLILLQAMREEK